MASFKEGTLSKVTFGAYSFDISMHGNYLHTCINEPSKWRHVELDLFTCSGKIRLLAVGSKCIIADVCIHGNLWIFFPCTEILSWKLFSIHGKIKWIGPFGSLFFIREYQIEVNVHFPFPNQVKNMFGISLAKIHGHHPSAFHHSELAAINIIWWKNPICFWKKWICQVLIFHWMIGIN